MKLERIKSPSDIKLDGITVEFTHVNDQVRTIQLTDAGGRVLVIERSNNYESLLTYIYVEAKPKLVMRWAVRGHIAGITVNELYEHERDARERYNLLQESTHSNCKVQEVEVPEELPLTAPAKPQPEDDMPF